LDNATLSKRKLLKILIPTAAALLAAVLVLLFFLLLRIPTAQEINRHSLDFTVELKSQTSDSIVTYGSAVLVNNDGYFVSNAHVITYSQAAELREFESYKIRFSFETEYREVALIAYDIGLDIAILKLEILPSFKLTPTRFSNKKLNAGDKVYAAGNGMNHGVGLTQGCVSLPRVNIEYDDKIRSVIQCDLIINDGNSGGSLLNDKGKLIGITTFRLKDNKGNPIYGMAFCIPTEIVIGYLSSKDVQYSK
jgi:S1-C subfamily serine protease